MKSLTCLVSCFLLSACLALPALAQSAAVRPDTYKAPESSSVWMRSDPHGFALLRHLDYMVLAHSAMLSTNHNDPLSFIAQLSTNRTANVSLTARANTNDTDHATFNARIGTNDASIATLVARAGTNDTNHTTLNARMGTNDASIATLVARVNTNSAALATGITYTFTNLMWAGRTQNVSFVGGLLVSTNAP